MKKNFWIYLLTPLLLVTTIYGWDNKKEEIFPEYDFAKLEARIDSAEAKSQKVTNDIVEVNSATVQNKNDISRIKNQITTYSPTRVEELEIQLSLLTEAYKDLYAQVAAIKVLPQVRYAKRAAKKPKGFSLSSTMTTLGGDEYSTYSRGMEYFRTGFYEKARESFKNLIKKRSKFSDRAYYWIGETYLSERSYTDALKSFAEVEKFSSSSKVDDAVYKTALCYLYMGENDKAKEKFGYIINRYPASEFVSIAKEKRKALGLEK